METTTQTPKTPSSTQWHAVLATELGPEVMTAPSEKELKKQLNELDPEYQVLTIIKGKSFKVRTKKAFEFFDDTETKVQ